LNSIGFCRTHRQKFILLDLSSTSKSFRFDLKSDIFRRCFWKLLMKNCVTYRLLDIGESLFDPRQRWTLKPTEAWWTEGLGDPHILERENKLILIILQRELLSCIITERSGSTTLSRSLMWRDNYNFNIMLCWF
jgi:hypothetical protein